MKRAFIGFCFFFLFAIVATSSAQQYKWVHGGGTASATTGGLSDPDEASYYMCTDYNGNVYSLNVVAAYGVTADTFSGYVTGGAQPNFLLTSYNCSGQMRWAKLIYNTDGPCYQYSLIPDSLGHIYIAGYLTNFGTLHIGYDTSIPTSGIEYLSQGLIQFDTSGRFNWIRFIGNNTIATYDGSLGYGSTLAVDGTNNIHFLDNMGSGVPITSTLTSRSGTYDVTYDYSGNLLNAKRLDLDSSLNVYGATIDPANNKLYTEGYISGSLGTYHPFIAVFDTDRNVIWSDTLGDISGGQFNDIVYDNNGHLYLAGGGYGYNTWRGDTVDGAAFILKIDTLGNPYWMRPYTTTTSVNGLAALTLMPGNKIGAVGFMTGVLTGGDVSTLSYAGEAQNPYFTVLDTGGNVHYIQQVHGDGFYDWGLSIASDRVGNLYIGGQVADSIWGTGIPAYHTHGGTTDFFVMKYGVDCSCTSMPLANATDTGSRTVGFTYTGTTASIDSFRWNFGDGGTSTTMSPPHTYTAAGTYTVTVTAYSYCGDDIHFSTVYIPCVAPPSAAYTDTGYSLNKYFAYTGTTIGIDSIVWHFGDGSSGSGSAAAHTYSTGTYTACVITYNPCGSDSSCSTVTVINCAGIPSASFTHSGAADTISFSYTGPTSYIDSVVWNFGDGRRSTGLTVAHIYSTVATFTACVTVYTRCGNDTACASIAIPCVAPPAATFTTSGTTAVRNFSYTGTTTSLDSVVWHFGDGARSTGTTTSHTYSDTGTFTACVAAYNACGVDSACHALTIPCMSAPVASFSDTGTHTVGFAYTGTTTGLDSVAWLYGDGTRGSGLTSLHTYARTDTYTICAIAYNACGFDTSCNTVVVFIPCDTPVASFTHASDSFTYTSSTTGIDSVVWSFGDGSSARGNTATHSYSVSGTYHVCVTAFTNCAADSVCSDIHFTGTGVNSVSLNRIQVFPNPATDELTVTGIVGTTKYRLLDVSGVSLQSGVFQIGNNSISVKGFAAGLYLLELTAVDGTKTIVKVSK